MRRGKLHSDVSDDIPDCCYDTVVEGIDKQHRADKSNKLLTHHINTPPKRRKHIVGILTCLFLISLSILVFMMSVRSVKQHMSHMKIAYESEIPYTWSNQPKIGHRSEMGHLVYFYINSIELVFKHHIF